MTAASSHFFGQSRPPHTIVIARGENVRQFTLRPWLTRTALGLLAFGTIGGAALALQTASRYGATGTDGQPSQDVTMSYELRIASLRSEVDRLRTRGFADRAKVSDKLDLLLDQQAALSDRYSRLQSVLDRARSNGLVSAEMPVPSPRPAGEDVGEDREVPALAFAASERKPRAAQALELVERTAPVSGNDASLSELIRTIGRSLDAADTGQAEGLNSLASRAREKSAAIDTVLRTEGIGSVVPRQPDIANEGGPFVPATSREAVDAGIADLAQALDDLQAVRAASSTLPLAAPVASTAISSTFGVRSDPFLGRAAMHTGIDFVAGSGAVVKATAPGRVVFAGENGAYGRMVEVEHDSGLTTRYAHLSAIAASVGEKVKAGSVVGSVGSTGRSTGPHLHYELRRTGNPIDPARFLRAGRRIETLG